MHQSYKLNIYVTPRENHFWPQGHFFNKLGSGQLVDATYQISRLRRRVIIIDEDVVPLSLEHHHICVVHELFSLLGHL